MAIQAANVTSLPSNTVHPVFGKVSYRLVGDQVEVTFTMMPASIGEGWRTAIAMDASTSMQHAYGKMLVANIPDPLLRRYRKRDWARDQKRDGKAFTVIARQGWEDAFANGLARWSENLMKPRVQPIMKYFTSVDTLGGTTMAYFGCGKKGEELEVAGIVNAEQVETFDIGGPEETAFGRESHLLPALKYLDDNFKSAPMGLFVLFTDGGVKDLEAVKSYSVTLAKRIASGKRNPIKCFIVGVGDDLDERPLVELDNLMTNTTVDLWDYENAGTLRQPGDVIREIVDENAKAVQSPGKLLDERGGEIMSWPDGVPSRVTFQMSEASTSFELAIEGQEPVRQKVRERAEAPPPESEEQATTEEQTEGIEPSASEEPGAGEPGTQAE